MPIYKSPWGSLYYTQSRATETEGRPALLLIAGAGETILHWPPQLRHHKGVTVYALDLPGHGRSEGSGCTRVTEYMTVVHAFAAEIGLTGFVLVGHSMGGAVALRYMQTHPERLRGSVLVGTGARLRVAPEILDGLVVDFDRTSEMIVRQVYAPGVADAFLALALTRLRENDPQVLLDDFTACNQFDMMHALSDLHTPTLILCGSDDRMTPPIYSDYLHTHLPNSRLQILEGAGHMAPLEQPGTVVAHILRFLDELPTSAEEQK